MSVGKYSNKGLDVAEISQADSPEVQQILQQLAQQINEVSLKNEIDAQEQNVASRQNASANNIVSSNLFASENDLQVSATAPATSLGRQAASHYLNEIAVASLPREREIQQIEAIKVSDNIVSENSNPAIQNAANNLEKLVNKNSKFANINLDGVQRSWVDRIQAVENNSVELASSGKGRGGFGIG